MRALFLAAVALGALAGFSAIPDQAQAANFPFCIKGQDNASSLGDCRFPSYASCQAAASGTFNYCDRNPFYAYGPQQGGRSPRLWNRLNSNSF